ncbi:hypothetical protein AURDEDRAFT_131483 [Auricularia subglabra TFB-10046 SS5]|uniref:Uncharacterized protein n=1 Tax=Auricularia subglabra (strain TFB-10046 / SS5) TaxID=717982 RepID=J0WN92_AURST|nr:hypothetical protein AURDEDRAFT_131483 [Auricularia subglabra TFB-10046 SS5]
MPPKQFPPGSRKRPHSAVGGVMFDSTNVRDASAGSSKRSSVTAVAHPKAASASLDSPLTIRQRVKLNQQQQDVLELVNAPPRASCPSRPPLNCTFSFPQELASRWSFAS